MKNLKQDFLLKCWKDYLILALFFGGYLKKGFLL